VFAYFHVPLLSSALIALELSLAQAKASKQISYDIAEPIIESLTINHIHHYCTDLLQVKPCLLRGFQGPLELASLELSFINIRVLLFFQAVHTI